MPESIPVQPLPTQIAVTLTLLVFLPAVLVSLTPFLRISIILHFLRQAMGTQSTPSNQILIGIALFLTLVTAKPLFINLYEKAFNPYSRGEITLEKAFAIAEPKLKSFYLPYCKQKDLALLIKIEHQAQPRNPEELTLDILIPAYVLSELRTSFQIGAALFLPFLIVDLVVAAMVVSAGMNQLPPALISTPLKLMLFLLVDGWDLVIGNILQGLHR